MFTAEGDPSKGEPVAQSDVHRKHQKSNGGSGLRNYDNDGEKKS
jgi:hypothetical protein